MRGFPWRQKDQETQANPAIIKGCQNFRISLVLILIVEGDKLELKGAPMRLGLPDKVTQRRIVKATDALQNANSSNRHPSD